jgi:hypothetical protein
MAPVAAFRLALVAFQGLVVPVKRRAIAAHDFGVAAHVQKNMRMVKRGQSANAHEFAGTYMNEAVTGAVMEMGGAVVGHESTLIGSEKNAGY